MSSSKTSNIGLNQWQRSDFFVMDDFNADNQKIDAAFGKVAYVKLADITTAADANQVDVDLSSFDMSKYSELRVTLRCNASASSTAAMKLCVNDLTDTIYKCGSAGTTDYLTNPYMGTGGYLSYITVAPLPGGRITAICFGISCDSGAASSSNRGGVTLAAQTWLTKLNFISASGYSILAGTRITVYGVT